jgi:predicted DNA-binding protein
MNEILDKEVNSMKGTSYLLRVPNELEKKINSYSESVSKPGFEFNRTKFIIKAIEEAIEKQTMPMQKSA